MNHCYNDVHNGHDNDDSGNILVAIGELSGASLPVDGLVSRVWSPDASCRLLEPPWMLPEFCWVLSGASWMLLVAS